MTSAPHLRLVGSLEHHDASGPEDQRRLLAGELTVLLGALGDDAVTAPLALPLALSLVMERHGVDVEELGEAFSLVRPAVLVASGMDRTVEPVPLRVGDAKASVLSIAEYLHGLLGRAARGRAVAREVLAATVAAQLHTA